MINQPTNTLGKTIRKKQTTTNFVVTLLSNQTAKWVSRY